MRSFLVLTIFSAAADAGKAVISAGRGSPNLECTVNNDLGDGMVLSASYDYSTCGDFIKDATLTGAVGDVKYALKQVFRKASDTKLKLSSVLSGTALSAEYSQSAKAVELTASGSVAGVDISASTKAAIDDIDVSIPTAKVGVAGGSVSASLDRRAPSASRTSRTRAPCPSARSAPSTRRRGDGDAQGVGQHARGGVLGRRDRRARLGRRRRAQGLEDHAVARLVVLSAAERNGATLNIDNMPL